APRMRDLWHWSDLDPAPMGRLGMIGQIIAPVCWLGLVVWFFAFSGLSWKGKLIGVGVALLLAAAGFAGIDGFTIDGNLRVIPHFRWQPRPQEQLARYLEERAEGGDLSPIDLSVDPVFDYPRYRGSRGDGVVRQSDLLELTWEKEKPRQLWR